MSSGSKTTTTTVDPYASMPDWLASATREDLERRGPIMDEAARLAELYADPDASVAGMSDDEIRALRDITDAAGRSDRTTQQAMGMARDSGFDPAEYQNLLRGLADRAGGQEADFGQAFDTQAQRDVMMGDMDRFADVQGRYQDDYTDAVIDPTMERMREDEARNLAQLEAQAAGVGGGTNTRMAVERARMRDEGSRSRAQTEAELRSTGLREGQDLGMQEIAQRGQLAEMAGAMGMSESELDAQIAQMADRAGMDRDQMIAQMTGQAADLGLSGAQHGLDQSGALAQLAQQRFQTDATAAGVRGGFGETQRQIDQQRRDAPRDALERYAGLYGGAQGMQAPTGQTTSQQQPSSTGSQIFGGLVSLGGAALSGGMFSDERIKEDVEPIASGLDLLRDQRPSSYSYTDPKYDRVPEAGRRSAGLMAQDLERIPGAVGQNAEGIRYVDPYPVMATIVRAVQELDERTTA